MYKKTVTVYCQSTGSVSANVEALVHPTMNGLAVHKNISGEDSYCLTHINSGLRFPVLFSSQRKAIECGRELGSMYDYTAKNFIANFHRHPKMKSQVMQVCDKYKN